MQLYFMLRPLTRIVGTTTVQMAQRAGVGSSKTRRPGVRHIDHYLFGRTMKVAYKGALSTSQDIFCGVPQGSILGPLLFLLHFNELPTILKHCKILMYADDTVLYCHHHDLGEIEKILSEELSAVSTWLQENELILNIKKGKTEIMVFGTKARLNKQDRQIEVKYLSHPISVTQSYKYLGVLLDPSLNMNQHFNYMQKGVYTYTVAEEN
jgi:hypothetical protein